MPGVTPRVRNGDALSAVFVPPAFSNAFFFCEYCSVAKYRRASTPL